MKKYITLLLLMNVCLSEAQNNPIFSGGTADGWATANQAQAANAIFKGGGADGWTSATYAQSTNAIFKGGVGDGWNFNSYAQNGNGIFAGGTSDGWSFAAHAQASNAIFTGGAGDGWASRSFQQPGNGIFNGGTGDGWNYLTYLQAGNSIHLGGSGDGWASTYRPLGPLPVTLLTFTAEKQSGSSLLKWQTSKEEGTDRFDVERSSDAVHFEKTGTVAAAGTASSVSSYRFTDPQPLKGYNYYRLKQVDKSSSFVYTPVRLLVFDGLNLQGLKVYPVPATSLLTVELPAQILHETVVINVSNALGVMVWQMKTPTNRADNRRVLNLADLPPGSYTLQVSSASFSSSQVIIKQ